MQGERPKGPGPDDRADASERGAWLAASGRRAPSAGPKAAAAVEEAAPSAEVQLGRVEIVVEPRGSDEGLFRELVGAYLAGAEEIVVRWPPESASQARRTVREFVRRTERVDFSEPAPGRITLRDARGTTPEKVGPVLARMVDAATEIQRAALRIWDEDRDPLPTPCAEVEDRVDRLAWLVERRVVREGGLHGGRGPQGSVDAVHALLVARSLERLSDHGVRIVQEGAMLPLAAIPADWRVAFRSFHRQAFDVFQRAGELGRAPTFAAANSVLDAAESVHSYRAALLERVAGDGSIRSIPASVSLPLGLILESIDRVASYSADIAEAALDRAMALRRGDDRATPSRPGPAEPEESLPGSLLAA